MNRPERIAADKDVLGGRPAVRGTRLSVSFILEKLAAGSSAAAPLAHYPQLRADDIRACLRYAGEMLDLPARETSVIDDWIKRPMMRLIVDENASPILVSLATAKCVCQSWCCGACRRITNSMTLLGAEVRRQRFAKNRTTAIGLTAQGLSYAHARKCVGCWLQRTPLAVPRLSDGMLNWTG